MTEGSLHDIPPTRQVAEGPPWCAMHIIVPVDGVPGVIAPDIGRFVGGMGRGRGAARHGWVPLAIHGGEAKPEVLDRSTSRTGAKSKSVSSRSRRGRVRPRLRRWR